MRDGKRAVSAGDLKNVWMKAPASPPLDRSNSNDFSTPKPLDRGVSRSSSGSCKDPARKSRVAHAKIDPEYANSRSNVQKVLIFCAVLSLLVILLIWDMRQVQQMSEIIHNDKTNLWVRLNNSQIKEWLSPLDICMMKLDDSDTDVSFYRNSNCSSLASVSESVPSQLYCNIGSSIGNKPCYPPLTTKTYFKSALKDEALGNPRSMRLRNALRALAAGGKPVVFVGDGLSKQNQDAMICEIMRTDSVSIVGHYSDTAANYTIQWKKSNLRLNVLYFQLTRVRESTTLTKKSKFVISDNEFVSRRRRYRRLIDESPQEVAAAQAAQAAAATQARMQAAIGAGGGVAATTKQVPNPYPKQAAKQMPKQMPKQAPKMQPIPGRNPKGAPVVAQPVAPSAPQGPQGGTETTRASGGEDSQSLQLLPKYPAKPPARAINGTKYTGGATNSGSQSSADNSTKVFTPIGSRNRSTSHGVLTFDKIKKYVNRLVYENDGRGIVLIANVGVYYNSREMFRTDIPLLLGWMDEISREDNCTVFYRETAAQHYNHTPSGYYDMEYDERPFNNGSCVPVADSTPGTFPSSILLRLCLLYIRVYL